MKIHQREFLLFFLGLVLVALGLMFGNSQFAMLISLVLAVASFFNKKLGVLLLIVLIPIRPFLITINPGFKIIGDAIIFIILLRTIFEARKNIKSLFVFHKFELAFIAFLLIGVISALLTGVSLAAIIMQLRAYMLFYLLYYSVKRMEITTPDIMKLSWVTFVTASIMSVHGIIEKVTNKTVLMPEEWKNWTLSWTNYVRVYGLIKGPNELSLYLLIAFLVGLWLLKNYAGKMRVVIYINLILITTTFLLTYSRGTALVLLAFALVYFIVERSLKPLIPIIAIGIVSAGLFMAFDKAADYHYYSVVDVSDNGDDEEADSGNKDKNEEDGDESGSRGLNRYKDAFSGESIELSSSYGRLYYVKKALEVWKDHPVIGTGFGTFGGSATITHSSPIYDEYDITRNFYSDNQYILLLAETGILGVLSIILTGIFLIQITWQNRKDKFYSPLMLYFIIAVLVGGAVYNILENDVFMMYYFILLGYVLNIKGNENINSSLTK